MKSKLVRFIEAESRVMVTWGNVEGKWEDSGKKAQSSIMPAE